MMKHETTFVWPEPIPGFDPVQWKREVHAKFQRETEGMTDEEVREYYRHGAERFDEDMKQRRAKLAERKQAASE